MIKVTEEIINCQDCRLAETRNRAVPGNGPVPAALMLIGEAPGKSEDEKGMPFTGAAGKVLDTMLEQAGLTRDSVFITSVVKCRPPKNRNPRPEEVAACSLHLLRQIKLVQPRLIVVMGNVALQSLLDRSLSISTVRGQILKKDGFLWMPVFHPAAVLYNRSLEGVLRGDFQKVACYGRQSCCGDRIG